MKPTSPFARNLLLPTLLAVALGGMLDTSSAADKPRRNSSQVAPNLFKWTDESG